MKTLPIAELDPSYQTLLEEATFRTSRALNKVSSPQTSAIIVTDESKYYGNNIFLSNCTLICAEASALAATVAASDTTITALYLSVHRTDGSVPKLISPCGNCRQMLHDFAHLNGKSIDIYSTTSTLDKVMITNSDELLPEGFKSVSLEKFSELPS